jgi:hypothetical protein
VAKRDFIAAATQPLPEKSYGDKRPFIVAEASFDLPGRLRGGKIGPQRDIPAA